MPQALFTRLRHWWARLQGGAPAATTATPRLQALRGGQDATVLEATTTPAVPYDEALLERARTQWQFGDWPSLATLTRDTLQHHPDRAKLALLAAAGHQQLGDTSAARQFTRLAQDWGCSKKLVAQVLIAGAHNTLARVAAAAGQVPRALKHFQDSIAIGTPNTDLALATQARVGHQWQMLGLTAPVPLLSNVNGGSGAAHNDPRSLSIQGPALSTTPFLQEPAGAATMLQALTVELQQQRADLADRIKEQQAEFANHAVKQNKDLFKVSEQLQNVLKKEMLNATKQLEAFLNVQAALAGGDIIPGLHGWPISPDLAAYLIELIRANDYDLIIEFGSGTSTVLMAKALAQVQRRRAGRPPVVQVAFEHLEAYHAQTLAQLRAAGLEQAVTVHLAPLAPYQASNGKTYPYYSCQEALAALCPVAEAEGCRALVLVDGPPASTGEHARYPALPVLMANLPLPRVDFLLDDMIRKDEQEVAQMWQAELTSAGRHFSAETLKLEKDAFLIRVVS